MKAGKFNPKLVLLCFLQDKVQEFKDKKNDSKLKKAEEFLSYFPEMNEEINFDELVKSVEDEFGEVMLNTYIKNN